MRIFFKFYRKRGAHLSSAGVEMSDVMTKLESSGQARIEVMCDNWHGYHHYRGRFPILGHEEHVGKMGIFWNLPSGSSRATATFKLLPQSGADLSTQAVELADVVARLEAGNDADIPTGNDGYMRIGLVHESANDET